MEKGAALEEQGIKREHYSSTPYFCFGGTFAAWEDLVRFKKGGKRNKTYS